tara:strand:+ start:600 stop:1040 length:441 start_codon:yes stop_codon:yes gene_type:complete
LITIYTDGSCIGNPGNGGWAFIILNSKNEKIIKYGYEKNTTNNRMELIATINAIKLLKEESKCNIITDSNYVKEGINSWIKNWKKNNWLTANKKDVKNKDLWIKLDKYINNKQINWIWVKGHSSDEINNMVDEIARKAAKELIESL